DPRAAADESTQAASLLQPARFSAVPRSFPLSMSPQSLLMPQSDDAVVHTLGRLGLVRTQTWWVFATGSIDDFRTEMPTCRRLVPRIIPPHHPHGGLPDSSIGRQRSARDAGAIQTA